MSTIEVSQADLLRSHIEKRIDENYDYSKPSMKKNDIKEFVNAHPELNKTEEKIRKHYSEILKQVAGQKGKTPEELGIKRPRITSTMAQQDSDMDVSIEARPQSEILVGAPPVVAQSPTEEQPEVPVLNSVKKGNHDEKAVVAALTAFYLILKTGFAPLAELLTDDEKDSLGKLGKPVFDRFFGENEDMVICFLGIGGVFVPKLSKGRKLKKERKELEEKPVLLEQQ